MLRRNLFNFIAIFTFFVVLSSTAALAGKVVDFQSSDYQTPEQISQAAKELFQNSGLKKIKAGEVKNVAIVEFSVEYITSEKQTTGAGKRLGSGKFGLFDVVAKSVEAAGVGEKRIEIDEELKTGLPQKLYDALESELTESGFTVLAKDDVTQHPAYIDFRTKEAGEKKKKKKGTRGGGAKATTAETYPVEGLAVQKKGVFASIGNSKVEARLMDEIGVDMTLRVHLRVGAHRKGKPSIEEATIFTVASGVNAGKMPSGKTVYSLQNIGSISAKKSLTHSVEVVSDQDFKAGKGKVMTVDSAAFEKALLEMFAPFSKAMVSTLL